MGDGLHDSFNATACYIFVTDPALIFVLTAQLSEEIVAELFLGNFVSCYDYACPFLPLYAALVEGLGTTGSYGLSSPSNTGVSIAEPP